MPVIDLDAARKRLRSTDPSSNPILAAHHQPLLNTHQADLRCHLLGEPYPYRAGGLLCQAMS
jgi:hypothetical protein